MEVVRLSGRPFAMAVIIGIVIPANGRHHLPPFTQLRQGCGVFKVIVVGKVTLS
jgi:hypothetical protein